jgi:hypothetical protein
MTDITALSDGEYTAVVDTIEDRLATVFFEEGGDQVGSAVIDVEALPADARHADAIVTVEITDSDISSAEYRPDRTQTRRQDVQDRFDRLSSRPPRDDDTT